MNFKCVYAPLWEQDAKIHRRSLVLLFTFPPRSHSRPQSSRGFSLSLWFRASVDRVLINTWSLVHTQRRRENGSASWEHPCMVSIDNQQSNHEKSGKQLNLWLDSFSEPRLQQSQTPNKQWPFNAEGVKRLSFQKYIIFFFTYRGRLSKGASSCDIWNRNISADALTAAILQEAKA